MRYWLTFLLFFLLSYCFTQTDQSSYNLSSGEAVAVDATGNAYVVGSILVNLTLGPESDNDVFLAKYDSEGNQVWKKRFGTKLLETVADMIIDSDGQIFILGTTWGNFSGMSKNKPELFLTKFSGDGKQLWLKQVDDYRPLEMSLNDSDTILISAATTDENNQTLTLKAFDFEGQELSSTTIYEDPEKRGVASLLFDKLGNKLIAGNWYEGEFTGAWDMRTYLRMIDSKGKLLWTQELQGSGVSEALNFRNTTYMTGRTVFEIGERESPSEYTGIPISFDAYIASYDTDGSVNWIKQFGAFRSYQGKDIALDASQQPIIVGEGNGTVGGEPIGASDIFIVKYDVNGTRLWTDRFGMEEFDSAKDVFVDTENHIFITGYMNQTWDDIRNGDYGPKDAGQFTFLAKYTSDGQQVWLKTFENN